MTTTAIRTHTPPPTAGRTAVAAVARARWRSVLLLVTFPTTTTAAAVLTVPLLVGDRRAEGDMGTTALSIVLTALPVILGLCTSAVLTVLGAAQSVGVPLPVSPAVSVTRRRLGDAVTAALPGATALIIAAFVLYPLVALNLTGLPSPLGPVSAVPPIAVSILLVPVVAFAAIVVVPLTTLAWSVALAAGTWRTASRVFLTPRVWVAPVATYLPIAAIWITATLASVSLPGRGVTVILTVIFWLLAAFGAVRAGTLGTHAAWQLGVPVTEQADGIRTAQTG
ncbi:hypothetical protein BH23ACT9_BH23ACT9_28800 [soil metagenome]